MKKRLENICKGTIIVGVIGLAVCTIAMKRGVK